MPTSLQGGGMTDNIASLPIEILDRIAKFLDVKSAICLAQTCRALQPPAESAIWRSLTFRDGALLSSAPTALKIDWIASLMTKYPWRVSSVRILEMDLQQYSHHDLQHLLSKTLGGPEDCSLRQACGAPSMADCQALPGALAISSFRMDALQRMVVTVTGGLAGILWTVLESAPNLRHLEIKCTADLTCTSRRIEANTGYLRPRLLSRTMLRRLALREIEPSSVPIVAEIITNSPNLEYVAFSDRFGLWQPDADDPLLLALSRLPLLSSLEVGSAVQRELSRVGGFDCLERLSVSWDALTLTRGLGELIPPIPTLRHYAITPVAANFDGTEVKLPMPTHPFQSSQWLSSLQGQLAGSPNLLVIHYYPDLAYSHNGQEERRLDWHTPAFAGMIIFSWREEGDDLLCFRIRCKPGPHWIDGSGRGEMAWRNMAFFNGRSLPQGIFDDVLRGAGVALEGMEPARDLRLPDRTWELLRDWRASLSRMA